MSIYNFKTRPNSYLTKKYSTIGAVLLNWLLYFTDRTLNFIDVFSIKSMVLLFIMTKSASINFAAARCL